MPVDEFGELGLKRMDDEEIRGFLSGQKMGVLGLPAPGVPYLLPLSYGYDGESALYFTYILAGDSRKLRLTRQAEAASFLVYSVDSIYSWESVFLTGSLRECPEEEWEDLGAVLEDVWRPDAFQSARRSERVAVYEFRITEQNGIRQTDVPPGLDTPLEGRE
jgi:hypothetical protein